MPQVPVTPEQLPGLIEQHKLELSSVQEVLAIKSACLAKLDEMESNIASDKLSAALFNFVELQRIEYGLMIRSLVEKQKQVTSILAQLESFQSPIVKPQGRFIPPNTGPGPRRL